LLWNGVRTRVSIGIRLFQIVNGQKMIIVDNVPDGEYQVEIQMIKQTSFILEMLHSSKFVVIKKDKKDFIVNVIVNAQSKYFAIFSVKGNNKFTFKITKK
jgi:hypothetical protein